MGSLAAALLSASLVFGASTLLVLMLRPWVRRLGGTRIAYGLWALVPLAVLCALAPDSQNLSPLKQTLVDTPLLRVMTAIQSTPLLAAQAPLLKVGAFGLSATGGLLIIWAAGVLVFVLRLLWMETRLARRLAGIRPAPGMHDVYYLDGEEGPMVVGLWRSKIILPGDFPDRYETDERTLILAHERAHVSGRHLHASALAYLLLGLQWFNPLAHIAFARFKIDQELACDATVVANYPKKRAVYARAMFKTGLTRTAPPLACCWVAGSSNPTRRRIAMLKEGVPGQGRRTLAAAITIFAVMAGGLAAYAAVPSPGALTSGLGQTAVKVMAAYASPTTPLASQARKPVRAARAGGTVLAQADGISAAPAASISLTNSQRTAPNMLTASSTEPPFNIEVPRELTFDAAARAVGLPNAAGYGVDLDLRSQGRVVLVRCNTPQTPVNARC